MNINNPNEACSFLVGNGIVGCCQESQNLVACMDILSRMCACDPIEAKRNRYNQCIQNYTSFASRAQSVASIILSKANTNRVNFYLNGQLIGAVCR
jgi:hypothetical protein